LFDAVVTVEDVEERGGRGKPAPDLFLLAAQQIGVAPEHCR
jgi:beta-phosphoglucomutase-like phosphatase (HAD superfamily)